MPDVLPDGVYLNLPEATYFAQPRLGSTDLIRLAQKKAGWWWSSPHNPDRIEKASKERTYGSALHALMLEGMDAYESRFAVEPDPADYPGLVTTIPQIKAAMDEAGFDASGRSAWKAADWALAIQNQMPDHPCWPNILADFEDDLDGRERLKALDDRMLRLMFDVATDPSRQDNVDVRKLFDPAQPALAEVSVLWTEDGIGRRARLDKLLPVYTMDLKSLGNWLGRPLQFVIGDQIAARGYDIQRADYDVAREQLRELVAAGQVFGGTERERAILTAIAQVPKWDWVWLFYQKPDPSGRAPVLVPVEDAAVGPLGNRSLLLFAGDQKRQRAIEFYKAAVAEFGLDRPWAKVERLHYTEEGYDPRIFLPHWINEVSPEDEHAYGAPE